VLTLPSTGSLSLRPRRFHRHTAGLTQFLDSLVRVSRRDENVFRFLFDNFRFCFTFFPKFFSSFPHGTCSLSVSHTYLALAEVYQPHSKSNHKNFYSANPAVVFGAGDEREGGCFTPFPSSATGLSPSLVIVFQLSLRNPPSVFFRRQIDYNSEFPRAARVQRGGGDHHHHHTPGRSAGKNKDFNTGLLPVHSPLLR